MGYAIDVLEKRKLDASSVKKFSKYNGMQTGTRTISSKLVCDFNTTSAILINYARIVVTMKAFNPRLFLEVWIPTRGG